jgi:hypothetical protein
MIRTDIPFYPSFATENSPEGEHCVVMSLKMLLAVLMPGHDFSLHELEQITHKSPIGGAFATHYLIWLADQGYEVKRWDTYDWRGFEKDGVEYIRRAVGEEAAEYSRKTSDIPYEQSVINEFLRKVPIIKQRATVEIAEQAFGDGWLLRAPVNSRILNRKPGYLGHSVVVIGFEGDDVIFHDPGMPPVEARRESRELFQQAMDSFGGELDAVRRKLQ